MIRKLYTILLIGLCLNLVACGDDNEGIDSNASAPVIKFPMEQLDVDLNKVDNLPVVAVIKSQAGLQSVTMKIQTVEGTVEYKTVTDFFNPNSYSLSENLEYNANYQAFIIEATDKLNHAITGTLPISVTDVVERPVITFDPEEIIYDEMDENPTIPRTTFKITSEAGLKTVEMYLVSASGQEAKGTINLSGEKEYTFDEMINYKEGDRVFDIYLCKHKQSAVTKNGKPYETVILQDKTGTVDGKIWDPNSAGIDDFDSLDYIEVYGDVTCFQGANQINIKRIRLCREGEYEPANYLPVSKKDISVMYQELLSYINSMENEWLKKLMEAFFVKDEAFLTNFKKSSAAKSVHHGFVGGLLEHTLGVVKLCDYFAKSYPMLKRDLLLAAAMCHDIGKTKEISLFPQNDYTDDGQLLGHIVIGTEMVSDKIRMIPGFPTVLASELKHCILAHHGEYEYGSPKKPALMEAMALNLADNADAKLETFTEILEGTSETGWLGYNRFFESNLRMTRMD